MEEERHFSESGRKIRTTPRSRKEILKDFYTLRYVVLIYFSMRQYNYVRFFSFVKIKITKNVNSRNPSIKKLKKRSRND